MLSTQLARRSRTFYGWWIVAAGALISGVGAFNSLGFTVFFLPLSQELGLSRAVTSLVHSVSRLEGGLLGPLSGWAIDRIGARRMLALGSIIGGLGFIMLGTLVHDPWALFLAYGLFIGIGFNIGFFPTAIAAVNTWFIRKRTLAMSVVNATWGVASFVLIPSLSLIVLHFGWRVGAIFTGCLIMTTALPALLIIRPSPESMGLLPDGAKHDIPTGSAAGQAFKQGAQPSIRAADFTVRQAIKTPTFWLMALAIDLWMVVYSALLIHFTPIMVWKGLSQQAAANMIGLWSLLIVVFSLGIGFVGDRVNKRLILTAGMLIGAVIFFLLAFGNHWAYFYLAICLMGIFDNMAIMNSSLMADYFGRKHFATLRGINSGVASVGIAASPVFAGWVWDVTQSYVLFLAPAAAILVISALIHALLPPPVKAGAKERRPGVLHG